MRILTVRAWTAQRSCSVCMVLARAKTRV